jgi:hypothetical protein
MYNSALRIATGGRRYGVQPGVTREGVVRQTGERRSVVCQPSHGRRVGRVSAAELRAGEGCAVRQAIALQEAAGLDVINDGTWRRSTWIGTTAATSGHSALSADLHEPYWFSLWKGPDTVPPLVTNPPTRLYI